MKSKDKPLRGEVLEKKAEITYSRNIALCPDCVKPLVRIQWDVEFKYSCPHCKEYFVLSYQ